ncbi:MAG: hypothetical protein CMP40_03045 [Rickettsiales bacterium]|nr:hypothetical protein [Rickettsiales bacterium]
MKKNSKIISKPKDASTVIIIKKIKKKYLVLMGKRPLSSRFMPGVYVFPGGRVEKEDIQANKVFKLKSKLSKKALKAQSYNHTIALLLAAIRETSEETGLYLINKKESAKKYPEIIESTWEYYLKKSYEPNIKKLYFFGRAITPSFLKTRFHARFFVAFYEDFIGTLKTNGELEDLSWFSLEDAKKKKIADVTEFMLDELIKLENNYDKIIRKDKFPMFTWRYNKKWIKWD